MLELTGAPVASRMKSVNDAHTTSPARPLGPTAIHSKPVYACSVLAIEAQGKAITTVESLMQGGKLHPIQQAFVDHDASQCGFCTPGFVVACKAFLDQHPNSTPEDIRRDLSGNLCGCGTYAGIREAIGRPTRKGA